MTPQDKAFLAQLKERFADSPHAVIGHNEGARVVALMKALEEALEQSIEKNKWSAKTIGSMVGRLKTLSKFDVDCKNTLKCNWPECECREKSLAYLSWDGFAIQGDHKSIAAVQQLITDRARAAKEGR